MRNDQLTRFATLDGSRADASNRTVPASLSSETPVLRGGGSEVLSHAAGAVDLTRAKDGLPLLLGHDRGAQIGIVERVALDKGRLVGVMRFGVSQRAQEVFADVQAGILKNVSVSYSIEERQPTDTGYIATRWTPHEASIVSVPADPHVGIGRSQPTEKTHPMNTLTAQTSSADVSAIRELVARSRLPDTFADQLVARGLSLNDSRTAVLDELARRDLASGGHMNMASAGGFGSASQGTGQRDMAVEALASRMRGASIPESNPYRHARIADIARESLERGGIRTTGLDPSHLIERAGMHSTSDFPLLLADASRKVLRAPYMAYQGGMKRAFKSSTARDFRAKQILMFGEAPKLLKVNEHGEFTHGTIAEAKESYMLRTYGRIFGITRQALINDDLNAFGTMAGRMGVAAAEFENTALAELLLSNPTMSDGLALFHASHNNLATGAGSVLQVSSLTAARKSMRLQKGLDGVTPIDAQPKYLIVPAALETTAEQILAGLQPTTVVEVNPFSGRLDLIVDPRLDGTSSTAWYLATDPNLIDTIEYSYLDSANGPEIMMEEGFSVDGMEFKVRLDFGAGVIDWRGLYRAVGA